MCTSFAYLHIGQYSQFGFQYLNLSVERDKMQRYYARNILWDHCRSRSHSGQEYSRMIGLSSLQTLPNLHTGHFMLY